MIADSNILILAAKPEHTQLLDWLVDQLLNASTISKVEVLGYHKLSPAERIILEEIFDNLILIDVTIDVIDRAVQLRQTKNMSLGDSIIAATSLIHGHELYTHNTKDFSHIPGLIVHDPITTAP